MSGRGGRSSYRGGRGNGNHDGEGRGQGRNYSGTISTNKRVLWNTLGTSVFDYGQKSAADQTRSSWEKLVQYVGTNYGQDISNELQNKLTANLVEPVHAPEVIEWHIIREQMIRTGQANIQNSRETQKIILEAAVTAGINDEALWNWQFWRMLLHRVNTKKMWTFPLWWLIQRRQGPAMSGAHTEREMLSWQIIEYKGSHWFLDSAHNCCNIRWRKTQNGMW